jgi:TonB family protein
MIKATIVLLAAHLIVPRLRRRSAAERHALWTASLTMAALVPVLTWLLPMWAPRWAQRVVDAWPAAFAFGSPTFSAGDVVVRATGVESGQWTLLAVLPLVWTGGSVLLFSSLAVQAWRLRRLSSLGEPAGVREVEIARQVAARLGLPGPRIATHAAIRIPLAWGIRRASVLLPRAAHEWPDDRVRAVCAHEMAHISRGDWLTHLLAEIACRIYWFNPLFWTARNRMACDSERAADDVVLSLGTTGADYASHLIDIVRAARPDAGFSPTVAMARGSGLESRVAALLNALANRARLSRRGAFAIAAGGCLIVGPMSALSARTASLIEIRTSNLPPIPHSAVRELAGDDSQPVRDIRIVEPMAGDVAPSVAEYTTPPLYSDEARRAGVEGVVVVQAHVDVNGRVSAARLAQGLGFGLDQNALLALRQWQFRPGERHGAAAAMNVAIEIAFTLRNESINAQIANDMVSLVGPGVIPPQAVRVVHPATRHDSAAGTVVLDVVLLEDGTPRIIRILRSVAPDIDDAAVRAFEQWRFSPAQQDGRPIRVRMNAEVTFHG